MAKKAKKSSVHEIVTDKIKISKDEEFVYFTRTTSKSRQILSKQEFTLTKIGVDELLSKRLSNQPGLVFKNGTLCYYSDIPKQMRPFAKSNLGSHMCYECGHMSALPDFQGGCRKVRDKSLSFYDINNRPNSISTLKNSKRIEKYTFISLGFEFFNTDQDSLIVLKCDRHTGVMPQPDISQVEVAIIKENLASYLDESFFDKL